MESRKGEEKLSVFFYPQIQDGFGERNEDQPLLVVLKKYPEKGRDPPTPF